MIRQFLWLTGSAIALFSISTTLGNSPAIATKEDSSVTEVRIWDGASRAPWQSGRLTVSDRETTVPLQANAGQSAAGKASALRIYDRHVAKLFEMTHESCRQNAQLQGMHWAYEAANGNVSMGEFRIRCQTAREIVSGYRLGQAKVTPITHEGRTTVDRKSLEIPTLQITGTKVENWMRFVQTIRPSRSRLQADQVSFQTLVPQQIKRTAQPKIPVVIPDALPKLPMVKSNDRFLLQPESNGGYRLCPTVDNFDLCDRMRVRGFQQIVAVPGGEFYDEKKLSTRDVYRKIELANGADGVYFENCGERSCQATVQWKQKGVLYELQAQYREQPLLVAIANRMITNPLQ